MSVIVAIIVSELFTSRAQAEHFSDQAGPERLVAVAGTEGRHRDGPLCADTYNFTRLLNIVGVEKLMEAITA